MHGFWGMSWYVYGMVYIYVMSCNSPVSHVYVVEKKAKFSKFTSPSYNAFAFSMHLNFNSISWLLFLFPHWKEDSLGIVSIHKIYVSTYFCKKKLLIWILQGDVELLKQQ